MMALMILAALALYGSGGAVSLISTNTTSGTSFGQYRVEASSSMSSSWVTSWSEYAAPQSLMNPGPSASYTSAWNGSFWTTPVNHLAHGTDASGNLFLTTDPSGRHVLVGLDAVTGPNVFDLFVRISTDSTGQTWGPMIFPLALGLKADFPSVAVSANGTIGVAFSPLDSSRQPSRRTGDFFYKRRYNLVSSDNRYNNPPKIIWSNCGRRQHFFGFRCRPDRHNTV